jgi:hypothetical protein
MLFMMLPDGRTKVRQANRMPLGAMVYISSIGVHVNFEQNSGAVAIEGVFLLVSVFWRPLGLWLCRFGSRPNPIWQSPTKS